MVHKRNAQHVEHSTWGPRRRCTAYTPFRAMLLGHWHRGCCRPFVKVGTTCDRSSNRGVRARALVAAGEHAGSCLSGDCGCRVVWRHPRVHEAGAVPGPPGHSNGAANPVWDAREGGQDTDTLCDTVNDTNQAEFVSSSFCQALMSDDVHVGSVTGCGTRGVCICCTSGCSCIIPRSIGRCSS